jgi:hypothetical protein
MSYCVDQKPKHYTKIHREAQRDTEKRNIWTLSSVGLVPDLSRRRELPAPACAAASAGRRRSMVCEGGPPDASCAIDPSGPPPKSTAGKKVLTAGILWNSYWNHQALCVSLCPFKSITQRSTEKHEGAQRKEISELFPLWNSYRIVQGLCVPLCNLT